jgi:hypothetical protein
MFQTLRLRRAHFDSIIKRVYPAFPEFDYRNCRSFQETKKDGSRLVGFHSKLTSQWHGILTEIGQGYSRKKVMEEFISFYTW